MIFRVKTKYQSAPASRTSTY